jgi:hypothetical protein
MEVIMKTLMTIVMAVGFITVLAGSQPTQAIVNQPEAQAVHQNQIEQARWHHGYYHGWHHRHAPYHYYNDYYYPGPAMHFRLF